MTKRVMIAMLVFMIRSNWHYALRKTTTFRLYSFGNYGSEVNGNR